LLHKTDLAKSNADYHRIRPTEAAEVDARLAAAAEKKAAKPAAVA
jgi:hypothetical protein